MLFRSEPPSSTAASPEPLAIPTTAELEAKKRWTRDDWVNYGLRALEEGGLAAIRVDDLAKRSGLRTPSTRCCTTPCSRLRRLATPTRRSGTWRKPRRSNCET